VTIFTKFIPLT